MEQKKEKNRMYTKDWYKDGYQKYKRRARWYELAYKSQTAEVKNLKKRIGELAYKLKKMEGKE